MTRNPNENTDWVKPGVVAVIVRDNGRSGLGNDSGYSTETCTIEKVGKRDVVVEDEAGKQQRFNLQKGLTREEGDTWHRVTLTLRESGDPEVARVQVLIREDRARNRVRQMVAAIDRMDWRADDWAAKVRTGLQRIETMLPKEA